MYLRPVCTSQYELFVIENQDRHYLRISSKNSTGKRDPEMHQTKKGNQWCVSRTRAQARDAVSKMGVGLPEPACRSRFQTASCCCAEKAW
jgi:hypothetical protein